MRSPTWLPGEKKIEHQPDGPYYPEHEITTLPVALQRIGALEQHAGKLRADAGRWRAEVEAHERTTAAALEFTRRLSHDLKKANDTIDGLRNENSTLHYLIGDRYG